MKNIRSFSWWCAMLGWFALSGCNPFITRFIAKSFEDIPRAADTVAAKIEYPILPHVNLSVLWVGHATCLIQIDDKVFLTDPMFGNSVGLVSKRRIEPGITPSSIGRLDYILISHIHFDHLDYGSLGLLPKTAVMVMPLGSREYTPEFGFPDYCELHPWEIFESGSVRITAVPVNHFNGRYGIDASWSEFDTFTGYVLEYQGKTVFFAGDTGYDPEKFKEIGRKFVIDVAFIPIAPVEPRDFMRRVHTDPKEALQIFEDVRATTMIPIHHRTFVQGLDSSLTFAQDQLKQIIVERHMENRVLILNVGEQKILIP
jgi:N-acyl-phosphatidylethanolamine-hydrolysing phospholipase D